MAKGEHVHEWVYNEVKESVSRMFYDQTRYFSVIRFCKHCLLVEDIKLQDIIKD